ncbi:MAG: hypothetical protein V2I82_10205, partial [Halieaceae bacterium]|nr:hypothetical protein [Halieaceae bacterium]
MHRFLSSASLLLLAAIASGLFSASTAYAQDVECNPSFVSVSTGKIRVLPSGGDDTDNLQCAVLEAGRLSLPRVELAAGDFSFTRLFFDAYRGTFGGTSADSTRMTVIPNSVDCGGAGQSANLVVVSGGDTKISRVRIDASNPCRSGSNFAVIAFVQPESEPACQRRTFFGEVDRVEVIGSASQSGRTVAISNVPPQQCFLAGQGTLGTFKVNRSTIEAFAIAIATQIWGQGQVDINFNSIDAVGTAIFIVDADQSTTITGNSIRYNGGNPAWTNQSFGYGVLGSTFSNGAPAANRTVIHNNRFFDLG